MLGREDVQAVTFVFLFSTAHSLHLEQTNAELVADTSHLIQKGSQKGR